MSALTLLDCFLMALAEKVQLEGKGEKMGLSPKETIAITLDKACMKTKMKVKRQCILSILGGVYIAMGYMAFVRVTAIIPEEWTSLGQFLGAAVFPIGLILLTLTGGELVTGNMMTLGMGLAAKRVKIGDVVKNWVCVGLGNLVGALLAAYLLGHVAGVTEGIYLARTLAIATGKVEGNVWSIVTSAIGCNMMVGLAVLLTNSSKSITDRLGVIWFPIMGFVVIGFQHLVANFFIIPAAIFAGAPITWMDFWVNVGLVFIGNALGGSVIIGAGNYWGQTL